MRTEVILTIITWIFLILGWVFFKLTILPIVFFFIAMVLSIINLHIMYKKEKNSKNEVH